MGPKGRPQVYDESSNSDKENVTTLFTVNADGLFAPPLTIFKYERIPANVSKAAPPNWGIGKTENGWMPGKSFYEYIANVFLPFLVQSKIQLPVIVFLDGHKSHLTLHLSQFCRENKIVLVALNPNSTNILQPLDVAVFGPLKKKWKSIVRKWRMENHGKEISKADVPSALSQIISIPDMKKNIQSGFAKTGIFPFDENKVDYTKCILRKTSSCSARQEMDQEELNKCLQFVESKIDGELLIEFKNTKNRNHDWEGDSHALMLFDVWKSISEDAETVLPESGEAPKSPGVSDVSALQSVPNEAGLIMLPHSSEAGTLGDNDNGTVCANKNSSLLSGFDDIQQSFSQTDLNVSLSSLFPVSPLPEQLIGLVQQMSLLV